LEPKIESFQGEIFSCIENMSNFAEEINAFVEEIEACVEKMVINKLIVDVTAQFIF